METELVETNLNDLNPPTPAPWGLGSTVGFSILVVIAFVGCQMVVFIGFMVAAMLRESELNLTEFANSMETDGLYFSIATIATSPICAALVVLFAGLRKNISLGQYFSMNKITLRQVLLWQVAILIFVALSDSITLLLGRRIVTQFMVEIYTTSGSVTMLWIALIFAAPLFEETFFRGFLFTGLQHSKLGPVGAIILTSLCWSAIHLQYDFYGIATIFVSGLLLGFARFRCNSLYPCFAMHSLMNLIATIEVAVSLQTN